MIRLLLVVAATALALSPDCTAQRRRGLDVTRMLERFGADKDGKLTKKEVPERMWRRLAAADADDDGAVTKKELQSLQSPRGRSGNSEAAWKFLAKKYDANADGKIEADEYDRDEATFARLDKNKDGVLTLADWQSGSSRRGGRDRSSRPTAPKAGQPAPDFELTFVEDAERTVKLSGFAGSKPVALIFGSCT